MSDDGRWGPGDHGPLGIVRGLRDVRGHSLLGGHVICFSLYMYERYLPDECAYCTSSVSLVRIGLGADSKLRCKKAS